MARRYEMVLIADPTIPEPSHDEQITALEGTIGELGGTVHKVDRWGRLRLAYPIKTHREGNYTLVLFDAEPDVEKEILRRIKLSDTFVRWLSIRADDEPVPTDEQLEELAQKRSEVIQRAAEREAEEQGRAEGGESPGEPAEAAEEADAGSGASEAAGAEASEAPAKSGDAGEAGEEAEAPQADEAPAKEDA